MTAQVRGPVRRVTIGRPRVPVAQYPPISVEAVIEIQRLWEQTQQSIRDYAKRHPNPEPMASLTVTTLTQPKPNPRPAVKKTSRKTPDYAPNHTEKHCAICGDPFIDTSRNQRTRFCSDRCKWTASNRSRRSKPAAEQAELDTKQILLDWLRS